MALLFWRAAKENELESGPLRMAETDSNFEYDYLILTINLPCDQ